MSKIIAKLKQVDSEIDKIRMDIYNNELVSYNKGANRRYKTYCMAQHAITMAIHLLEFGGEVMANDGETKPSLKDTDWHIKCRDKL